MNSRGPSTDLTHWRPGPLPTPEGIGNPRSQGMDSQSLAPEGGFGAALITVPADGEHQGEAHKEHGDSHAQVLARLLDFPGGVKLAELFDAPANNADNAVSDPMAPYMAERLAEDVRARLDSLEHMVLRPLNGRRAPTLPSPEGLWEALQASGALAVRDEAAARRLSDTLGEPYRSAFGASLRHAQAQVATLRWEIRHELRALGPRAAQLERFDAALNDGMRAKTGQLYDRMEAALRKTFEQACERALQTLPAEPGVSDLDGWLQPHGWLERYRERCIDIARAAFWHGRRNLEALVQAAELSSATDWAPADPLDATADDRDCERGQEV